jgi:hypothetical protein
VLRTRDSRIDNRLNLRNELDSLGIDDFLERTDDHLPYPLRRPRPTTLVVAVTFGVVDTCSISTGDGWIWVGRGFVAVTTDATLCPACSITTRDLYLINLTEIEWTLQPVNPRSTNRLNLRNEHELVGNP